MTKNVVKASPEMFLIEVAKILAQHNFDGMPVVDSDNKLVGVVSRFDILKPLHI